MFTRSRLFVIALVFITVGGLAIYHLHGQGHNHGASGSLQLNAGQKWESDQPLRAGMERIRELVNATNPTGRAVEMQALAKGIQQQVDYLTTHCKLPPAADETLHVMIADLLEGAELVTKENEVERGIATMRKALDAYPKYFNHADWRGLGDT